MTAVRRRTARRSRVLRWAFACVLAAVLVLRLMPVPAAPAAETEIPDFALASICTGSGIADFGDGGAPAGPCPLCLSGACAQAAPAAAAPVAAMPLRISTAADGAVSIHPPILSVHRDPANATRAPPGFS